jgi:TonB family protein
MAAHLFRPPLSFDESDPGGQVPEDLRALVLRLLAKSPDARLAGAEQLAHELREIQARFPLRGDELDDVFGGPETAAPVVPAVAFAEPEVEDEPLQAVEPAGLAEDFDPSLAAYAPPAPPEDPSVSLVLNRPARPARPLEESVSIPLGFGAAAASRGGDDPSWDRPARSGKDEAGLLYEPMDAVGDLPAAQPQPIRRSWLLIPISLGVFSLAIIFALVALYSVTSEFRLSRVDSDTEEVTEPVAPPAEDAETPQQIVEAQPVNEAPPMPMAETPLIEEISGTGEPAPIAEAREPVRPPAPQVEPKPRETPAVRPAPAPAPPPKVAQTAPPRREPTVAREGGVRPGPGVVPPIPLDLPRYSYPAAARGQGLNLDVRLDLLVDERGRVIEAVVREGDASDLGFNETALAAARRLTFQPATRGNVPVKMWTEMIFEFSDPGDARRSGR